MRFKRFLSGLLCAVMCLSMTVSAFAAGNDVTTSGGTGESIGVITSEATTFSVTVPTVLPVYLAADGTETVATDAYVVNNSAGPIDIKAATLTPINGWELDEFTADFDAKKVNSKEFGFQLQGKNVPASGTCDVSGFMYVPGNDRLNIVYDSEVVAQKTASVEIMANLVFTIGWYTGGNENTVVPDDGNQITGIKVSAVDKNGQDLNATASEITGEDKNLLLDGLEESGLVSSAENVDALIEVESDEFEDMADTTFDVSDIASEGDVVVILHYDEIKGEWEFIAEEIVDANGEINADFSSYSPVAFVVLTPLGSISLSASALTLDIGDIETLTVSYTPSNTTDDKTVFWHSNDISIATVDNGIVTAKSPGTTTITATVGYYTVLCNVTVNEPPVRSFADTSWSDIITACQSGNVPDTWSVGDTKSMIINGVEYPIRIIGKNHDTYSDGSGTAPLTFQLVNTLNEPVNNTKMNSMADNKTGWSGCEMRMSFLPGVLTTMPTEVQSAIKAVNKQTLNGSKSALEITSDKLFLLSEKETLGTTSYSNGKSEGVRYEFYANGGSIIKTHYSYGAFYYWLRTPNRSDNFSFCTVQGSGGTEGLFASNHAGVSFAFCF